MKNTIGDGMKMFRKYQLAVWRSIQIFHSHFTKVTRKCKCFSRIVEPCNTQVLVQITEIFMDHKFVSDATGCRNTQVLDCTSSTVFQFIQGSIYQVVHFILGLVYMLDGCSIHVNFTS